MSAKSKAETAFELNQLGIEVMRQNLRRRFPAESDAQLKDRLAAWLVERPHAPAGDADGKPSNRFD